MRECPAKVSRLLEQDLQERTEQAQARCRDNEKRKEVLRTASSIPRQEATSSLVKQMEKSIAPLKEEIRKLKVQGNTHALDATGPARVEERSGVNPRLTAQSRPDPRAEQRRTPQATIADLQRTSQRGRKNGAEVQDRSAPKCDRPSTAIPNADQYARANKCDAGKHRKRKRRRKGKGQAE